MDPTKLLMDLLCSPAGAAVITKFLTGTIHTELQKVDQSGAVDKYSKYLQPATVVLASLAALGSLMLQHQAGNFDPSTIVSLITAALVAHDWGGKSAK